MANLVQNPYQLNTSASSLEDQLESVRALNWELDKLWLAVPGTWVNWWDIGDTTRAIVSWAARCRGDEVFCKSKTRALFAQFNTPAWALLREPAVSGSRSADTLPRMVFAQGMSASRNITSWGQDRNLMVHALSTAIRTDPSAYVRLEVLRAIGYAPIPADWVPALLDAIQRAEAVLAQTPFDQKTRQTLAKYLSDVTAKLQTSLVQMPTQSPTGQVTTEPMTSGTVALPAPGGRSWIKPAIAIGLTCLAVGGGVLIVRRRRLHQPALSGAPKQLKPAIRAAKMIARYGGAEAEQRAYHKEDHATSADTATYWSKVAQEISKQRG
jgi:hypothetical protein